MSGIPEYSVTLPVHIRPPKLTMNALYPLADGSILYLVVTPEGVAHFYKGSTNEVPQI